jgi:hypothetical protein
MDGITYNLLGGHGQLGNQMFQYSLLLGIKHKNGYNIVIDPETKKNSYLFKFFDFNECLIEPFVAKHEYREPYFHFNSDVFNVDNNTNFIGYFQTEKYFQHCKNVVKSEFKFKEDTTQKVNEFIKNYKNNKLVSIHVRRGDYLVNPHIHPQPSLEYYNNSIEMLNDENTIFVFTSDDINWCKENFKNKNIIYSEGNLIFDMCLTSLCDDHIIANSTFSWWGAWLGKNPNKKIICPKVWFGEGNSHINTDDIYCDNFIKL